MKRNSGILMPVFSLPSKCGIGDFGKGAYKFIDFLKKSNQRLWQVLPLVQTGYGNSPYSSVSANSISPYFISPEVLLEKKLITKKEYEFTLYKGEGIDYGFLYSVRYPLLRKAFSRQDRQDKSFKDFIAKKSAYDYALFMTLKYASGQKHFYEWEDQYKFRNKKALNKFAKDYAEDILFWQFIQFEANNQWQALKKYANDNGVSIIGDLPLYSALDSVDVWTNPSVYKLDQNFAPLKVAGVPPDYFCSEGQLWGNPVYDYEAQEKDNFKWWTNRIYKALKLYDYIRIDHFRGLDRYYEIEPTAPNAMQGEWVEVPSNKLFTAIHKRCNKNRIIAEDLGIIDDSVRELMARLGYPGMKILSFAFNGEPNNLYLPQNIPENSIAYTGTHDNDTFMGLISGMNEWDYNNLISGVENSLKLFKIKGSANTPKDILESVIKLGYASKAKTFIMPLADVLGYGREYRINEPGTVSMQNWSVRFCESDLSAKTANKLKALTIKYKR